MSDDRLITVAIHTYDHAVALKALLEGEGVIAVLQNVNLTEPVISSGVRVRIRERDLPKALRIIENREIFLDPMADTVTSYSHRVLVPVDFTEHSDAAVTLAFNIAAREKASITLLHSYLDPALTDQNIQLTDTPTYDIENEELRETLEKESDIQMNRYARKLRDMIKSGQLPAVKFNTKVTDGLPEEVIIEYAREVKPELIVMGTRCTDKKERELIGSVTAEVLDSCRYPVFTVPESVKLTQPEDIHHIVLLCNLDQEDLLAFDTIYRLFRNEQLDVTIVHIPDKKLLRRNTTEAIDHIMGYMREHYPRFNYTTLPVDLPSAVDDFMNYHATRHIDLIAVPNKKKNIFARLFNPSLAHRILFHSDIPMVVIPV